MAVRMSRIAFNRLLELPADLCNLLESSFRWAAPPVALTAASLATVVDRRKDSVSFSSTCLASSRSRAVKDLLDEGSLTVDKRKNLTDDGKKGKMLIYYLINYML